MPYGVKRGYKAPGEFGLSDMAGLALSGSAGIVAALVTDYQQSAEASALYTLNRWAVSLGSFFGFSEIPLYAVILGIVAVGAGSIFYFQPITRQGAFAQGFGLLAVVMTAIPDDLAGGIEDILADQNLPGLSAPSDINGSVSDIAFTPPPTPSQSPLPQGAGKVVKAVFPGASPAVGVSTTATTVQGERRALQYVVRLKVTFEGGVGGDINALIRRGRLRGRLHNEDTGETYNLFRNAGGIIRQDDDTIIIDAGVPARSNSAKLWVRLECNDHKIEIQSAEARVGERLDWSVTVKKSSTPMFIQRLSKVYWF